MKTKELERLKKAIQNFELQTLSETGVGKISGGFANVEYHNYDKDYFDIELTWGVQSDCENTIHTENYKINRKTMEIT